MKNRKYNIIVVLTYLIPGLSFLILSLLFMSVDYQLRLYGNVDDFNIMPYNDNELFIYGAEAYEGGYVIVFENKVGAVIDNQTVIKVGWKFYQIKEVTENNVTEIKLVERKLLEEKQTTSIPLVIIFGFVGVAIGILVIIGKMDLKKRNWRLAALIGGWMFVIVFAILSYIISNILSGIVVVMSSYTLHYIEYKFQQGKLNDNELEMLKRKVGV